MEAEEILKLFYSYWFKHNIISGNKSLPFSDAKPVVVLQEQHEAQESAFSSMLSEIKGSNVTTTKLCVRALSDQCLRTETSFYESVITSSKLPKITSGTKLCDLDQKIEERAMDHDMLKKSGRRRSKGNSRSLSELEIKELKGFMDLGFVFTEEDKRSSLVSILPGLQRLGEITTETVKEDEEDDGEVVSRPYLSEAWGTMGQEKMNKTVMVPWSFPEQRNDITMKDKLKAWAHTVASTVR